MITADATGDELLVQWRLGGPEPPYEVIARCPKCAGSHLEEVFP